VREGRVGNLVPWPAAVWCGFRLIRRSVRRALRRRSIKFWLVFTFQISFNSLFRIADGMCQFHLGQICVRKGFGYNSHERRANGLLSLHNLQVIGNAAGEAIPGWVSASSAILRNCARPLDDPRRKLRVFSSALRTS